MFFNLLNLIKDMLFFTGSYSNNVFPEPLSNKEEEECISKMLNGDNLARNKLIEHNLRLVAHIVKRFDVKDVDTDDLISIGTIGLIKGIDTYKNNKKTKITTYAARCIQNEILMMVRSQRKFINEVSLEDKVKTDKDGNEVSLIDVLEDSSEHVESKAETRIIYQKIVKIINETLNEREREIVYLRYGIGGDIPKTQNEVAKQLNISRSYISRIEKKAIKQIQEKAKELV